MCTDTGQGETGFKDFKADGGVEAVSVVGEKRVEVLTGIFRDWGPLLIPAHSKGELEWAQIYPDLMELLASSLILLWGRRNWEG